MKKIFISVIMFSLSFFIGSHVFASTNFSCSNPSRVELTTVDTYQIQTSGDLDGVTFTSSNTNVITVSESGLVTPVADGFAAVTIKNEDKFVTVIGIFVTKDGTFKKMLADAVNNLDDSVKAPFPKYFMSLSINGNYGTDPYYGFGTDYMAGYFYKNYSGNNLSYGIRGCTDEGCIVQVSYSISVEYGTNGYTSFIYEDESYRKTVAIDYKTENEQDKQEVLEFSKNFAEKQYAYINDNIDNKFTVEEIIDKTSANASYQKVLKDKNFISELDIRRGDSAPESAMIGGFILLGKNGVYYDAKEIEIWQVLKIPKREDVSKTENIKKFFEEKILNSDEQVIVEETETDVYTATISKKNDASLLGFLSDLLVPRVYADETEKQIAFMVEEVEVTNNPQTGIPNITLYIVLAVSSLCGILLLIKGKEIAR